MGVDGGDLLDNISDHSLDCFRFAHSRERQRLLAEIDRLRRRPSSVPGCTVPLITTAAYFLILRFRSICKVMVGTTGNVCKPTMTKLWRCWLTNPMTSLTRLPTQTEGMVIGRPSTQGQRSVSEALVRSLVLMCAPRTIHQTCRSYRLRRLDTRLVQRWFPRGTPCPKTGPIENARV